MTSLYLQLYRKYMIKLITQITKRDEISTHEYPSQIHCRITILQGKHNTITCDIRN